MQERTPLDSIIYISVPEDFTASIGSFQVDPAILLPVEMSPENAEWNLADLSWEMILSAMLKILAYDPEHEHAGYYRRFVLAAKPEIVSEMTSAGILKAKNKDFDIAEEIFKALENLDPDSHTSILNLALLYDDRSELYRQTNRPDLADLYEEKSHLAYTRALENHPDSPDTHFNAAYFYMKQKNYTRVKRHMEAFIDLSDDSRKKKEAHRIIDEIESHNLMDRLFTEAYDFIRLGKEEEGIERIEEFLVKNPGVWNGWFLLGWAHRRLEHYEKGREAFLKARDLNPDNPDTLNELSICHMELGEYELCRKALVDALAVEPENTKIISNMGILSLKEYRYDEALGFFETVLALEPDDPIAVNYVTYLKEHYE